MKKFSLALLLAVNLFAAAPIQSTVQELSWPKGDSFLTFLEKNSIPLKLYYDLDSEDKEFLDEIKEGISYQISKDEKGGISQVLIPVNEELQAQIYKDDDGGFKFQLSPISYQTYDRVLSMPVSANPSQDIIEITGSVALAHGFYLAMKGEVGDGEFKRLKKGDRLAMSYKQKIRLGRTFGMPEIDWAAIEIRGKRYTVYRHQNKYYDKSGKKSDKFLLTRPISNARITSPFTPKRFHPILKRYKAHLGVDYGAPKGTPIKAAGEGAVKFVGTKSGYGKVVILKHAGAYETLYAHTNGFAKGIKTGVKVKQGQLIAYVGNTGMSTGSHLHFGVYKNGTAVNPETEIKVAKSVFFSKEEREFKNRVERLEPEIKKALGKDRIPEKEYRFDAAMDWEHPIAEPKSDVNLTLQSDDLNLTAQPNAADVNLTSEPVSGNDDANLTESNLTTSEPNLTVQPKAENNSSESKTDANETANLAAAKSAKPESNLTSAKASNKAASKAEPKKSSKEAKKTESNSSAKNNKDKPKQADKKKDKPSQEAKSESKKKKDVNASKDKSKKQKETADKKAKSKDKTAESSDKKSK
ncbi:peptidoglycan DD-metalloendopeptidase family protein [Campylobacter showae]|uniref:peptidoglycan DD-metalloendopeptidase family protein n=1 Tax=Campylobacter showae TaxID=204 RepID=UPI0028D37A5F|nr:peptidoglycan DD-metalloendopeptidase family protein [Campylobacter showae]